MMNCMQIAEAVDFEAFHRYFDDNGYIILDDEMCKAFRVMTPEEEDELARAEEEDAKARAEEEEDAKASAGGIIDRI